MIVAFRATQSAFILRGRVGTRANLARADAPLGRNKYGEMARMEENRSPINFIESTPGEQGEDSKERNGLEKLKPKPVTGFFLSFKNRILISTMTVAVGGVIVIGVLLQIVIFPRIKGDPAVITNIKIIHLVSSVIVIGIIWAVIEMISKNITLPLRELTERANQISRDAGKSLHGKGAVPGTDDNEIPSVRGDEITQLKTSFYRMLAYLRASEARLKDSERKYRFLFDNGPSPLFVFDAEDMRILDVNKGAERAYEYTREQLLEMTFWDLVPPGERNAHTKLFNMLCEGGLSDLPVFQQLRSDGSSFLIHLNCRLTKWRNRPAIIAAAWDVTEKLEKDAQLAQTAKMATLGEMATGVAHELNQPLNVVKIASDFLMKCVSRGITVSDADLRRTAEELNANVDRASHIIKHLRAFGRKAEVKMSPIDVNESIRGVFTLLEKQLEKSGIRCEVLLDDSLPPILGDMNRLEQVFMNLVVNARDAMIGTDSDPGESVQKVLRIESYVEDDHVAVTVCDNGPGVPEDVKSRVFEPFFTTKKVGEGTGIGLSISYGIVKEHEGTIDLVDAAGRGACFKLTFPVFSA
jgi:PAS domain S-box-containing protein